MTASSSSRPTLYSIGHSNHSEPKFLDLLVQHGIDVLADVRSQPFSHYNPQFNDTILKRWLEAAGIHYLFLGASLAAGPQAKTSSTTPATPCITAWQSRPCFWLALRGWSARPPCTEWP